MHNWVKDTPAAPESIIKGLQEKEFQIVAVSRLIIQGKYTIDHEEGSSRSRKSKGLNRKVIQA